MTELDRLRARIGELERALQGVLAAIQSLDLESEYYIGGKHSSVVKAELIKQYRIASRIFDAALSSGNSPQTACVDCEAAAKHA